MSKALTVINTLGVVGLVVVSVYQWRDSGQLRHRRDALIRDNATLTEKLDKTEKTLVAANATIEEFRKRIEVLDADNTRLNTDLRAAETKVAKLTAEVARLEQAVAAWKEAVEARDKVIAEQNGVIKEQVDARNEAIVKFNELVTQYNELAERLTTAEKLVLSARAERDKAIAELKAALAVNES